MIFPSKWRGSNLCRPSRSIDGDPVGEVGDLRVHARVSGQCAPDGPGDDSADGSSNPVVVTRHGAAGVALHA